jgi:hypothetical protein
MPTVLRVNGFTIKIFLPTREHGPAHVHVYKQGGEVVMWLRADRVEVRESEGMSRADERAARAIVEAHADLLRAKWREYHE